MVHGGARTGSLNEANIKNKKEHYLQEKNIKQREGFVVHDSKNIRINFRVLVDVLEILFSLLELAHYLFRQFHHEQTNLKPRKESQQTFLPVVKHTKRFSDKQYKIIHL